MEEGEENPYQYTPRTKEKKGLFGGIKERYKEYKAREPIRYRQKLRRLERKSSIESVRADIAESRSKRREFQNKNRPGFQFRDPSQRMAIGYPNPYNLYPTSPKKKGKRTKRKSYRQEEYYEPERLPERPSLFSGRPGLPPGF